MGGRSANPQVETGSADTQIQYQALQLARLVTPLGHPTPRDIEIRDQPLPVGTPQGSRLTQGSQRVPQAGSAVFMTCQGISVMLFMLLGLSKRTIEFRQTDLSF